MNKTSLRLRLFGLWALSLVACCAVAALLVELHDQSTAARVGRADVAVVAGCDSVRARYEAYAAEWPAPPAVSDKQLRSELASAVNLALAERSGVEGGVWRKDIGSLAYAFPTYAGTGPKTDLPVAERDSIQAVNEEAAASGRLVDRRSDSLDQTLLLHACPLPGPIPFLTAWTMTRIEAVPYYDQLRLGLTALLGFMALLSAWLGRLLMLWARYVDDAGAGSAGASVAPTPAPKPQPNRAAVARHKMDERLAGMNPANGRGRGPRDACRAHGDRARRRHHRARRARGGRDVRGAEKRVRRRRRQARGRRNLRRKLSGAGSRQDSRPRRRPRRGRPGRRLPDGGVGRPHARRGEPSRRRRHHHVGARRDDRRRQSPPVGLLRADQRRGSPATSTARSSCWPPSPSFPASSRRFWSTTRFASCWRRWCWN